MEAGLGTPDTQIIHGDTESHSRIKRAFRADHWDVNQALAKIQNARIHAGNLITHN
jgi:hypothetical protein